MIVHLSSIDECKSSPIIDVITVVEVYRERPGENGGGGEDVHVWM